MKIKTLILFIIFLTFSSNVFSEGAYTLLKRKLNQVGYCLTTNDHYLKKFELDRVSIYSTSPGKKVDFIVNGDFYFSREKNGMLDFNSKEEHYYYHAQFKKVLGEMILYKLWIKDKWYYDGGYYSRYRFENDDKWEYYFRKEFCED